MTKPAASAHTWRPRHHARTCERYTARIQKVNTVPTTHPTQKQALADLCSRFEWACDHNVMECSEEEIEEAQGEVARDTDLR